MRGLPLACLLLSACASFGRPPAGEFPALVAATEPTVVKVRIGNDDSSRDWAGSGVWVSSRRVLTNAHVATALLRKGTRGVARSASGREIALSADVELDERCDLALLTVTEEEPGAAPVRATDPVLAERVWFWGAPDDGDVSLLTGHISRLLTRGEIAPGPAYYGAEECELAQLGSSVYPGMSGGPVYNERRELVGLNVLGSNQIFGRGFAVSGSEIRRFLRAHGL